LVEKKAIGHAGLDDFKSEDGIISMFSEKGKEDFLFRGQFMTIKVKSNGDFKKFFGQIIDEPKNYPVSGRSDSSMNLYPILHHESVGYVPDYQVVSKIKLLGEYNKELKLASHFTRPKPASLIFPTETSTARALLNVSGKEILGSVIGYEKEENPITVTLNNSLGRKQLGIFGMTGTGKSNTSLRMAEIFADMGWCVIFLDYLGEYVKCMHPSDEKNLFTDQWKKLGLKPEGNKDVKVFIPTSDIREIEGAKKFTLKTSLMSQSILLNMFCKTEAQDRLFIPILRSIPKKNWHLKTFSNEIERRMETSGETAAKTLCIIKARIDNELDKSNRLFDNYNPKFAYANHKSLEGFESIGVETPKETPSELNPEDLLNEGRINVFDFKNVSERDYAATLFVLLKRLYSIKKEHGENPNDYPKVMMMIEEAHIPFAESEKNIFSSPLNNIAREVFKIGRHYYLNICAISQRPCDIPDSVLSQINTRVIHRLKDSKDIRKVITGDIREYETGVSALKTGEAIIDSISYVTPLTVKIAPSKSKKIDPFIANGNK
jgi:DNA helicase HerA-like ATPase